MSELPLSGVTLVDCSEGVAGAYAGRLLADLGATVVKVEPPRGEGLRHLGPYRGDASSLESGGLHLALNAAKHSIVADLDGEPGRARFLELVAGADVLLESAGPGVMASRGLGYDTLGGRFPHLVYVSHSPFGQDGPYACRCTSEIVDYAMGGYMYFSGDPARHPLLLPGHQAELHAGMHMAAGALIALWHARQTGAGQHIDVSTMEAILNDHSWLTTMWTHLGMVQTREPSAMIPCLDGHVFWMPVANPQLWVLIDRPDLIDDPRWTTLETWRDAVPEVRQMVAEWAASRTKQEAYHEAQAMRVALTPVNTMADLAESEQLAARNWWRRLLHPEVGEIQVPGPPWILSSAEVGPRAPAPLLDSDRDLSLPTRTPPLPPYGDRANRQPLEGIRVLEITANWAGPLAGRHLADMGADVLKIELARKPATRALHHAGNQPWTRPYNRAGYFNLLNRNKRDLVLDMATPEGRDIFLRLVEGADVVLENNSARVFDQLGLAYPALAERNPRVIMCSISGMGATGPERNYVAYGSNIEASAGLVSQLGYGDGLPFGTGSYYADPLAGTHATIAIMAALLQRKATGAGQFIDMALQESGMAFNVEALMEYQLSGRIAGPCNNRSSRIAPQGVYHSFGTDCWLAIGIETDEQWQSLCAVINEPDLARSYPTVADRRGAHDEIDRVVSAWSAKLDHQEAARILQAAGVPAGPVLANWEIVSDPHLYHRGYFVDIVHPEVGHHRWDGYPWRFSRTPGRVRYPSPLFGEHNDEILEGILGLSSHETAELRERGVIAGRPII
jgi:crotonobetainyl-CoA:carnitine CoA-transferase CaiB-like acyl-CoA transferase